MEIAYSMHQTDVTHSGIRNRRLGSARSSRQHPSGVNPLPGPSPGQQATTEAMTKHPLVQGWVREFDDDPCQLCQWWAREGRI